MTHVLLPSGSLIFQDGISERDFVVVSAQNSAIPDLHYEFRTVQAEYGNGTVFHTNVSSRTQKQSPLVVLARMEWISRQIGTVKMLLTRPLTELPMASLCLPGSNPGSRYFILDLNASGTRSQYTWTRTNAIYVLTGPGETLLARYERLSSPSQPPPHAVLHFYFQNNMLLLMALLSLTLNRWMDGPNSPI
ncbi:hypothetical protein CPB86DRAFT_729757, partial [Serendipita vermifera]